MIFSARARPMPEVAPTTRTVLYGKGMMKVRAEDGVNWKEKRCIYLISKYLNGAGIGGRG